MRRLIFEGVDRMAGNVDPVEVPLHCDVYRRGIESLSGLEVEAEQLGFTAVVGKTLEVELRDVVVLSGYHHGVSLGGSSYNSSSRFCERKSRSGQTTIQTRSPSTKTRCWDLCGDAYQKHG
jgi:hypothetical protein